LFIWKFGLGGKNQQFLCFRKQYQNTNIFSTQNNSQNWRKIKF